MDITELHSFLSELDNLQIFSLWLQFDELSLNDQIVSSSSYSNKSLVRSLSPSIHSSWSYGSHERISSLLHYAVVVNTLFLASL